MLEVRIGTITITKESCGDYYASFQLASDQPFVAKAPKTGSKVGIDLNIENFYADSNGKIVDNPHYYRKAKKRLAKAQRKLGKGVLVQRKNTEHYIRQKIIKNSGSL